MGRCKQPGSLNSFFLCASQLSGARIQLLDFITSLVLWSLLSVGSRGSWQLLDHRLCSSFGASFVVPSRCRDSHLEAPNCWWLWYSCLLTWQDILYFVITPFTSSKYLVIGFAASLLSYWGWACFLVTIPLKQITLKSSHLKRPFYSA